MSNEEFLQRLERALLNRVPQEDVDDAMNYHREYFAEAGENAAQELPAPEAVAEQIVREREEYLRRRRWQWAKPVLIAVVCVGLVATAALSWGVKHFFRSLWIRDNSSLPAPMVVDEATITSDVIERAQFTTIQDGDQVYVSGVVGAFHSIVVEGVSDAVIITQGDEFYLDMQHSRKESVSYEVKDGTLYITGEMTGIFSTGFQRGDISIAVPRGLSMVLVNTDMGDITMDGVNAETADLNANLGKISVFSGVFGVLECNTDMGDVAVTSVIADSLKCYCNAGNVDVIEFDTQKTELEADLGNVTAIAIGPESDYALELEVDLGAVMVDGQKVSSPYSGYGGSKALTAKVDVGNVTVDFTDQSSVSLPPDPPGPPELSAVFE